MNNNAWVNGREVAMNLFIAALALCGYDSGEDGNPLPNHNVMQRGNARKHEPNPVPPIGRKNELWNKRNGADPITSSNLMQLVRRFPDVQQAIDASNIDNNNAHAKISEHDDTYGAAKCVVDGLVLSSNLMDNWLQEAIESFATWGQPITGYCVAPTGNTRGSATTTPTTPTATAPTPTPVTMTTSADDDATYQAFKLQHVPTTTTTDDDDDDASAVASVATCCSCPTCTCRNGHPLDGVRIDPAQVVKEALQFVPGYSLQCAVESFNRKKDNASNTSNVDLVGAAGCGKSTWDTTPIATLSKLTALHCRMILTRCWVRSPQ